MVPGVAELLPPLAREYPLGIVTAREHLSSVAFLESHNLLRCFDCVASARTCRHTKPHPDPVLWACEQLGIPAKDCLMVGDTTVDIRAGAAAGAQTVGVLCGFGERDEMEEAGGDLILESTSDLRRILLAGRDTRSSG